MLSSYFCLFFIIPNISLSLLFLFHLLLSNRIVFFLLFILYFLRDALYRMKAAYETTPAMGDPATVEVGLAENSKKLENLLSEKRKFEGYLERVNNDTTNGKPITPFVSKKHTQSQPTTHHHRNSLSEESLSRSASDSSFSQVSSKTPTNNGTSNSTGAGSSENCNINSNGNVNNHLTTASTTTTGNGSSPNSMKNANVNHHQSSTTISGSQLHPDHHLKSNGSVYITCCVHMMLTHLLSCSSLSNSLIKCFFLFICFLLLLFPTQLASFRLVLLFSFFPSSTGFFAFSLTPLVY